MDTQIQALNAVSNAASKSQILVALNSIGKVPGALLSKRNADEKSKGITRLAFAIAAVTAILIILCFAYKGGGYISEYTGPAAIVVSLMDIGIVWVLYRGSLKNHFKWIAVAFELISLLFLGYAMKGYFGGGHLRTAAEKKVAAASVVAKQHYVTAKSISGLLKAAAENAATVTTNEEIRDGKGVVFAKAKFVASMKADSVAPVKPLPTVPVFSDLTEANNWLQKVRNSIGDASADYDAKIIKVKIGAASTEDGLLQALKTPNLSSEQISNLQMLITAMKTIREQPGATSKIAEDVLTLQDMESDGSSYQSYLGYLLEFVVVFFVLMLASQKSSDEEDVEDIKEEELRGIIESILKAVGIPKGGDIKNLPAKDQAETLEAILASETLTQYVKNRTSFSEFLVLYTERPSIARELGGSVWTITDMRKEMQDQKFLDFADSAVQLTPTEWRYVKTYVEDLASFFAQPDEVREQSVQLLLQIVSKTSASLKEHQIKTFLTSFGFGNSMNEDDLRVMEKCVASISTTALLLKLNPQFLKNASPVVAEFLCKLASHEERFARLTAEWTEEADNSIRTLLDSEMINDEQFNTFMRLVINQGGVDAINKVAKTYTDKKSEVGAVVIGSKTLSLEPNIEALKKAINDADNTAFYDVIESAFVVKADQLV